MQFIDTHTHLFLPEFDLDRNQVIENAKNSGVKKLLLPNVDSSTIDSLKAMVNLFPDYCIPMAGLHPTSVNKEYKKELKIVEKFLAENKVCAIGEIGIDLYWDRTFYKEQEYVFRYQIDLANHIIYPL